jgi:predicted CopG family antitoxin
MVRKEYKTTIEVDKDIREALKDVGVKGESYSDIIRRVLREWRISLGYERERGKGNGKKGKKR